MVVRSGRGALHLTRLLGCGVIALWVWVVDPLLLPRVPLAAQSRGSSAATEQGTVLLAEARETMRDYLRRAQRGDAFASRLRPEVVAALSSASRALPHDDWLAGQRVAFLVKSDELDGALAAARGCGGSAWWCAALTGFVLHIQGEGAAAESAFDAALRAMPPAEACRWNDVSPFLEGQALRSYQSLSCGARSDVERRVWWAADPLFLRPGNDRRAEHYARQVGLRLHDQSLSVLYKEDACGDPLRRALLRTGFPDQKERCFVWWSFVYAFGGIVDGAGYSFLPGGLAALDPAAGDAQDWSFHRAKAIERYFPRYATFYDLDQQSAFFVRGDSLVLVAATDVGDGPLGSGAVTSALFAVRDERSQPIRFEGQRRQGRVSFTGTLPRDRYLVSLELLGDSAVGRARTGVHPPAPAARRVALSDLLLWRFDAQVPEKLDAVSPGMLPTTRLPAGSSAGLFWETYGLAADEALDVSLSVTRDENPGERRRNGQRPGPSSVGDDAHFTWREATGEGGVRGRAFELDLSNLNAGVYTIVLEVRTSDGDSAVARRRIELIRP